MSQESLNLYDLTLQQIVDTVKENYPGFTYDFKKHVIVLMDDSGDPSGVIRLPLHFILDPQLNILSESAVVLYLSIESGNAALQVMEGELCAYHTTFSAYMTRKKQGMSQIKYLNKKGKSRAGSRVRLAKTLEFFESINNTLTSCFDKYEIDRIAINCSASLIPYLHNSKVSCPFEKKDERLYKIPLHIPQSNFTNLDKAIKKLKAPLLIADSIHYAFVDRLSLEGK